MTFDWDSILGPTQSADAYLDSLLHPDSLANVPSLTNSEESSPGSTGASEQSPEASFGSSLLGLKRKNDYEAGNTQKDIRVSTAASHTHDEVSSLSKSGKAPISDKRRDQNRAAQRAFRERKEAHVKELEGKVQSLEASQRERDFENENLRDLVNQLRKENERLGAGQSRFAQSAFTFSSSNASKGSGDVPSGETSAPHAAPLPPPVASFPSIVLGGMGGSFLAELSGTTPRQSSTGPSLQAPPLSTSSGLPNAIPSQNAATQKSDTLASLFTAEESLTGHDGNLFPVATPTSESLGVSADADRSGMTFDQYFLGLADVPPDSSTSPGLSFAMSPASDVTRRGVDSAAVLCPQSKGDDLDIDSLCAEMKSKATCQEYARQALEAALQEDAKTMAQFDKANSLPL